MDLFGIGFKSTFGFRPSRVKGMEDHEQAIVSSQLKDLAGSFRYWSSDQSKQLASKPSRGDTLKETRKNLRAHARGLKSAAGSVELYKKLFWRAHKLAKNRGYVVLGKYTDYLPQETRNRR